MSWSSVLWSGMVLLLESVTSLRVGLTEQLGTGCIQFWIDSSLPKLGHMLVFVDRYHQNSTGLNYKNKDNVQFIEQRSLSLNLMSKYIPVVAPLELPAPKGYRL